MSASASLQGVTAQGPGQAPPPPVTPGAVAHPPAPPPTSSLLSPNLYMSSALDALRMRRQNASRTMQRLLMPASMRDQFLRESSSPSWYKPLLGAPGTAPPGQPAGDAAGMPGNHQ